MRLSSSKMSEGTGAVRALATVSFHDCRRVCSSWLSSATDFPSAEVRMITPKFFGLMLSTRWRRRSFSAVVLIFWEIEILSLNGMSTMYRPVKAISVVRRGPFDEMGSFTICTISSRPAVSWSVMVPCLSMSGSSFMREMSGSLPPGRLGGLAPFLLLLSGVASAGCSPNTCFVNSE